MTGRWRSAQRESAVARRADNPPARCRIDANPVHRPGSYRSRSRGLSERHRRHRGGGCAGAPASSLPELRAKDRQPGRQLPRRPRGDAMERQAELTEIERVLAFRGAEDCAYAAPTANRSFRTPREAARISRLRVKPPRTAGWRVILRARRSRAEKTKPGGRRPSVAAVVTEARSPHP